MLAVIAIRGAEDRLFSDIWKFHPDEDIIKEAKENGWMNGYEDGTFRPNKTITNKQLATVLERAIPEDITRVDAAYMIDTILMPVVYISRGTDNTWTLRVVSDAKGIWYTDWTLGEEDLCVWYRDGIDGELRPHYDYLEDREHDWCWTHETYPGSGWFYVLDHRGDEGEGYTVIEEFYPEYLADGVGRFKTTDVIFKCIVRETVNSESIVTGFYNPPCSEERESLIQV